jgi:hypothetical protein
VVGCHHCRHASCSTQQEQQQHKQQAQQQHVGLAATVAVCELGVSAVLNTIRITCRQHAPIRTVSYANPTAAQLLVQAHLACWP